MQSRQEVSESDLLDFLEGQVMEWETGEMDGCLEIIETLAAKLEPWELPLPDIVYFVKCVRESDEVRVFYTRQNAIFIPEQFTGFPYSWFPVISEHLLNHELFHIITRYNPSLRDDLYEILGFHRCPGEIVLPEELIPRLITNADSPRNEHYVCVDYQNQPIQVVPILYTTSDYTGGSTWNTFHGLVIEPSGANYVCRSENGQPLILSADQMENFYEQIGRNTDYIMQPEEILAENFFLMIQEAEEVNTPRIIEEMAQLFTIGTAVQAWSLY
ncbi:MAG: hypothetical protein ABIH23_03085 [bacterium]